MRLEGWRQDLDKNRKGKDKGRTMTKRAILYGRVSTEPQRDDGYSLQTQFEAMRQYAERLGFIVVGEYTDDISGTVPVAERPGGRQVYEHLRRRDVDAAILYTIDRVAHDEDVLQFGIFKRDCKRAGVELHFVDTGKSADNIMGGMIEYFKAAAAAEERLKIRERTSRGRIAKAKSGKWVGTSLPFGFRKVGTKKDTRMEKDEAASSLVRRIFAMYLGLEGYRRATLWQIAVDLTKDEIPTRRGRRKWGKTAIRWILRNRIYVGEYAYKGHIVNIPELTIIPREWFDAAQVQLQRNRETASRNRKHEYLLSNRFRCVWLFHVCQNHAA